MIQLSDRISEMYKNIDYISQDYNKKDEEKEVKENK
jgi:hypothetical protein